MSVPQRMIVDPHMSTFSFEDSCSLFTQDVILNEIVPTCDVELMEVARPHGLPLIDDSCTHILEADPEPQPTE